MPMEGILYLHSASLENKRDPSNSFLMQTDGGPPKSASTDRRQASTASAQGGLICLCGLVREVWTAKLCLLPDAQP